MIEIFRNFSVEKAFSQLTHVNSKLENTSVIKLFRLNFFLMKTGILFKYIDLFIIKLNKIK